jgi:uncharacterized protein (DUF1697 family)
MAQTRFVALLRGVNVGRAKRLPMAELRAVLEELGFGEVATILNSGNAVFSSGPVAAAGAGARIERAVFKRTGIRARTLVLSADEVNAVLRDNPLRAVAVDPSRSVVAFLRDEADRERLAPFTERRWEPEAFALGSRVAYLWCAEGILASRLAQALARALGDAVTSRNWATLLKIQARLSSDA